MPLYDMKCRNCENIWPERHGVDEMPDLECPKCGSTDVFHYLGNYGRPTIIFKGTGWASMDSALDAIGMPEPQRNSEATKRALEKL